MLSDTHNVSIAFYNVRAYHTYQNVFPMTRVPMTWLCYLVVLRCTSIVPVFTQHTIWSVQASTKCCSTSATSLNARHRPYYVFIWSINKRREISQFLKLVFNIALGQLFSLPPEWRLWSTEMGKRCYAWFRPSQMLVDKQGLKWLIWNKNKKHEIICTILSTFIILPLCVLTSQNKDKLYNEVNH